MKGKTRERAIRAQIVLIEALISAEQIRAPAGAMYKGENIGGRWIEKDTPFTIKTTPESGSPTSAKEKGISPKTFTDAEEQAIAGVAAKVKVAVKDIRPKVDADDSISSKDKKTMKEVLDDVDVVADALIKKASILDTMDDNVKIPFGERVGEVVGSPGAIRMTAISLGILSTAGLGLGLGAVAPAVGALALDDVLSAAAMSAIGGIGAGAVPAWLKMGESEKEFRKNGGTWIDPLVIERATEESFPIPQELVGTPEGEKMKKEAAKAVASLKTAAEVVKKVAPPEPVDVAPPVAPAEAIAPIPPAADEAPPESPPPAPTQKEIDSAIAEDAEQTKAIVAEVAKDSPPKVEKKMLKGVEIAVKTLTGVKLHTENGPGIFQSKLQDVKEAIVAEATDIPGMVAHLMGAALGTLGFLWLKPGLPTLQTFAKPKPAGKNARRLGTVGEVAAFGLIDEVLLGSVVEATVGTGFFAGVGVVAGLGLLSSFAVGVHRRLQEKSKLEELSGEDPREIARTKKVLSMEAQRSLVKHRQEIESKVKESLKEQMLSNAAIRHRILAQLPVINLRGGKEKGREMGLRIIAGLTRGLNDRKLAEHYGLSLSQIQNDVVEQVIEQILADFEKMSEEERAVEIEKADRALRRDAKKWRLPTKHGLRRSLLP